MTSRTIKVDYLARVEGEGALEIHFQDNQVTDVKLRIFEPPRFFEGFLRGRAQEEAPDITARICGICPVAYQMSAIHAIEDALKVEVNKDIKILRRLLYFGEWIQSHCLHMFLLHAPDFLGYEDAMRMAKDHRELVQRGLRMKKLGNRLMAVIGGRDIHPINTKLGGFYRAPTSQELTGLVDELHWARAAAVESATDFSNFDFPQLERDYEFVALHHPDKYAFCEGRIVSNRGLDIDVQDYDQIFEEQHVPHSTALHSIVKQRGEYLCGPLARFNLNFEQLTPLAKKTANNIGLVLPCINPFKSLLVRAIEVVHCFDEAIDIIQDYKTPETVEVEIPKGQVTGYGATEAPRGLLYHRYRLNKAGLIEDAKIVPPTSQNQKTIESDLVDISEQLIKMPHDKATWLAEHTIRNYDPCISCSTHFLKLKIVDEN